MSKKSNLPAKRAFEIRFLLRVSRGKKHFYPRKCLGDGYALRCARGADVRRKSHFSDFFDGLKRPAGSRAFQLSAFVVYSVKLLPGRGGVFKLLVGSAFHARIEHYLVHLYRESLHLGNRVPAMVGSCHFPQLRLEHDVQHGVHHTALCTGFVIRVLALGSDWAAVFLSVSKALEVASRSVLRCFPVHFRSSQPTM